ncbi:replication initiator protein A [Apilactobacillus xinyiensis]|uniref:replication initiator protein A n=1 Tax=Apilactobacillus xinyiensis TaxID=2841032 RepID=UPI00200E816D|nr:replication initiator protein A [Apilactobacillus xinyiensis]MCL0329842.1 replication initiator protein A [Apilactobacillus xinyiensis]
MTNTQFYKQYHVFEEAGLRPNEVSILTHLYDRMNLSIQNNNFYDKKYNSYYVIYTREEMAQRIHLSLSTITRVCKRLVKLGWLVLKSQFNAPNRVFLPHFILPKTHARHNEQPKTSECTSNQTELNHTNQFTNDTDDTGELTNKISNDKFNALGDSLITQGGLSKHVVEVLKVYAFGDCKTLYDYAGLIFKAKSFVYNEAKECPNGYRALRFELNETLNQQLPNKLKNIIISANQKAHNVKGYIMRALTNFFEENSNEYLVHCYGKNNIMFKDI